jgi:hypothetical protein
LAQTLTGFLMAWLYLVTQGHAAIFVVGFAAASAALFVSWMGARAA